MSKAKSSTTITRSVMAGIIGDELKIKSNRSRKAVDAIVDFIKSEVSVGHRFPVKGFGTISANVKSARPGLNPKTRETCEIKPRISITLSKTFTEFEGVDNRISVKNDLIKVIATAVKCNMIEAENIRNVFFSVIYGIFETESRIEIRGFGVFYRRELKSRTVRNPKTGEKFISDDRLTLAFKASNQFRLMVEQSGNFGEF